MNTTSDQTDVKYPLRQKSLLTKFLLVTFLLSLLSCTSYEQFKYMTEDYEIPSKVFKANYDLTWAATLEIMKMYPLKSSNLESGVIKTRWKDNTLEVNFSDSFGGKDAVKAAKFKLIINLVKGFRGTREVTKVTVYKRQLVERDFLQGAKVIPSDGIMEQAILYRIGKIIDRDIKLKKIEEQKNKELEKDFD